MGRRGMVGRRRGMRRFVSMWAFCSRGFIMGVGFGLVGREDGGVERDGEGDVLYGSGFVGAG